MKVKSRLADVDFVFGSVERKKNSLVISSHPSQTMKSKVYVSPQDVLSFLGKLICSPSALLFVLGFPFFYIRARKEAGRAPDKRVGTRAGRQ